MDDITKAPLISVIIPSYNSKPFIKETINSVLNQTYDSLEVILIDDGSTDGTTDLFPIFEQLGVLCFTIENSGASRARNIGLKKANGDYIQFLDADDMLHPRKIEKQIDAMQGKNATLSYCKWVNFTKDLKETSTFRFQNRPYAQTRTGRELMKSFGMDNWFIPVFAWLSHKSLLEQAGPWNTEISNNDDGEYFSRVLYRTKKVICVDEVLGYYRTSVSTDTLSKLNSEHKIHSAFKSYQLIESLLKQDKDVTLLSYPKRLYYTQFKMIRFDFPELATRTASAFDKLSVKCFIDDEKSGLWIKVLGLEKGMYYYNRYRKLKNKILDKIRKLKFSQ